MYPLIMVKWEEHTNVIKCWIEANLTSCEWGIPIPAWTAYSGNQSPLGGLS